MRRILATLFCLFACVAHADALDYDAFAHIPIQHEGRIKPMASFALAALERFYGHSQLGDKPAIAWLAGVMFDPANAMQEPVFLVKDVGVQTMLGLPFKPDNLYSFAQTTQAMAASEKLVKSLLQQPAENITSGQRAVLELYENTGLFAQIMLSCTLFLHLAIDLPAQDKQNPPDNFIDYFHEMPDLQKSLQAIIKRKGANIDRYTPPELKLAQAVKTLDLTLSSSHDNTLLRVIPPQWSGDDAWLSPWAIFHESQGSPQTAGLMASWRELAGSYQSHDAARWQSASHALQAKMQQAPGVRASALSLEVLYYRWNLLGKTILLYIAGFVFTLFSLSGLQQIRSPCRVLAVSVTAMGAVLHAASIIARITILQRPPVGTLYESLLFVSLIAVLFGLFLEYRLRNTLGLLAATLAGSVLLFASQSFGAGDTMNMLIAVLNTNFWLATHVLCITTGYGFGIIAGIIAHVYLIMRCCRRDPEKIRQVLRGGYGTALIALLFTSLGTILGGIWADQSWGRFWGWDPKENGALLICLWLIWLLHGRISGQLQERGFALAMAMLTVVISLSWLGVNLLATGLHSYGFTDKAALSLGLFCAAEFIFASITYGILWRREHAALL